MRLVALCNTICTALLTTLFATIFTINAAQPPLSPLETQRNKAVELAVDNIALSLDHATEQQLTDLEQYLLLLMEKKLLSDEKGNLILAQLRNKKTEQPFLLQLTQLSQKPFPTQTATLLTLIKEAGTTPFSTTIQDVYGTSLQKLFDIRPKDNKEQLTAFQQVLTTGQATNLLSQAQKEYVQATLISQLAKDLAALEKPTLDQEIITKIQQLLPQPFSAQVNGLTTIVGQVGSQPLTLQTQDLYGPTLQKLFEIRPTDNKNHLKDFQQLLTSGQTTNLLSQAQKEYVANTLLPQLAKDIATLEKPTIDEEIIKQLQQLAPQPFVPQVNGLTTIVTQVGTQAFTPPTQDVYGPMLQQLFESRPKDNKEQLIAFQQLLTQGQATNLLSQVQKDYVASTLLTELAKDLAALEKATQAPTPQKATPTFSFFDLYIKKFNKATTVEERTGIIQKLASWSQGKTFNAENQDQFAQMLVSLAAQTKAMHQLIAKTAEQAKTITPTIQPSPQESVQSEFATQLATLTGAKTLPEKAAVIQNILQWAQGKTFSKQEQNQFAQHLVAFSEETKAMQELITKVSQHTTPTQKTTQSPSELGTKLATLAKAKTLQERITTVQAILQWGQGKTFTPAEQNQFAQALVALGEEAKTMHQVIKQASQLSESRQVSKDKTSAPQVANQQKQSPASISKFDAQFKTITAAKTLQEKITAIQALLKWARGKKFTPQEQNQFADIIIDLNHQVKTLHQLANTIANKSHLPTPAANTSKNNTTKKQPAAKAHQPIAATPQAKLSPEFTTKLASITDTQPATEQIKHIQSIIQWAQDKKFTPQEQAAFAQMIVQFGERMKNLTQLLTTVIKEAQHTSLLTPAQQKHFTAKKKKKKRRKKKKKRVRKPKKKKKKKKRSNKKRLIKN